MQNRDLKNRAANQKRLSEHDFQIAKLDNTSTRISAGQSAPMAPKSKSYSSERLDDIAAAAAHDKCEGIFASITKLCLMCLMFVDFCNNAFEKAYWCGARNW